MRYPKITNIIRGAVTREGLTDNELSKVTGIARTTLQTRYRAPETWRLYEIGSLLRHVSLTEEEFKEIRRAL